MSLLRIIGPTALEAAQKANPLDAIPVEETNDSEGLSPTYCVRKTAIGAPKA